MAKAHFFITLFILLGKCMPRVHWSLGLDISNGGWRMPSGYEETDYTNLGVTKQVADQVVMNSVKLQEMSKGLEGNNTADQITRIVMSILLVGTTVMGIFLKIRGIKKDVNKGLNNGGQQAVLPMTQARGLAHGYPASF